jgi:hypothetical protein
VKEVAFLVVETGATEDGHPLVAVHQVLLAVFPCSVILNLRSRVSFMRFAIRPRAHSQLFSSQHEEPGARYMTFFNRSSELVSPRGQPPWSRVSPG